ncbi:MAG: hypothetical protein ACYTFY_10580 [Planctomycetota bacterium]|jgi:hypothetical protein
MKVIIDKNRITHIDGKPFFLLGARHTPAGASAEDLAAAGFNAYRKMSFGNDVDAAESYPSEDEPLFFWSYIYDRTILGRNPAYRSQLSEYIKSVRNHKNLLCYENTNEVARFWKGSGPSVTPEELQEGTDLIRSLDPDHPVWIAHTRHRMVETLVRYNVGGEITGCNCFPVIPRGMRQHIGVREDGMVQDCPDPTVHSMGLYTRKMMQVAAQGGSAVWMQVQAMAYENWFNPKHSPEMAGQVVDESKIIYPDYHQLRFMAYDSIICGATGLAFAMYKTPLDSQMWQDTCRVVGELKGLTEGLTAPPYEKQLTVSYEELGYTIWEGVITLARCTGDKLYIFAANTAFDPARAEIKVDGLNRSSNAVVVGENREVAVEQGSFRDDFEPYGVHVYCICLR